MNMDIALWGKKRKEEKDIFEAAYHEKYDNKILAISPRASRLVCTSWIPFPKLPLYFSIHLWIILLLF